MTRFAQSKGLVKRAVRLSGEYAGLQNPVKMSPQVGLSYEVAIEARPPSQQVKCTHCSAALHLDCWRSMVGTTSHFSPSETVEQRRRKGNVADQKLRCLEKYTNMPRL